MHDVGPGGEPKVVIEVRFSDDDLDRVATRVVELLSAGIPRRERWLDVAGAAAHLGMTENAIRGLVKRGRIPVHRTDNGRLRFVETELDHWVRTRSCERTHEDLP